MANGLYKLAQEDPSFHFRWATQAHVVGGHRLSVCPLTPPLPIGLFVCLPKGKVSICLPVCPARPNGVCVYLSACLSVLPVQTARLYHRPHGSRDDSLMRCRSVSLGTCVLLCRVM
jgi:hypothetical protein